MSPIVAGKACKECGKSYWVSMGHPKWYDDVVKHRWPLSDEFKEFVKMAKSGMCPDCFLKGKKDE